MSISPAPAPKPAPVIMARSIVISYNNHNRIGYYEASDWGVVSLFTDTLFMDKHLVVVLFNYAEPHRFCANDVTII